MPKHLCMDCGKRFDSGRDFEAHDCVTKLRSLSIEELRKLLEQRQQPTARK